MSRLQLLDHILIPQVPQPFVRMPQPLTEALRARKVALVGVGSGGGEIALHLASAGVGNLTLFDYDRLEPENYIRHVLDRRDVGRMKTAGLTDALRDRTLDTNIVSYPADVLFWANEFRDILKEQAPD